ncbi:MAG: DsrE family protein [Acidiferrobacteraceae bacterium]
MKHVITALVFLSASLSSAFASPITGVVVQGNGSKIQFEHAVKLAENMHQILKHTQFQVVVFGPTVKLLTTFSNEDPLIQQAQDQGITIMSCGRSMTTFHIKKGDLLPGIPVVPYGAVYIVQREKDGWQYFRP